MAHDSLAARWRDVARRTMAQVKEDQVSLLAASVAFFGMLAVFPAIIAIVSVYGLVADPDEVRDQIESLTSALPEDAGQLITNQLESITQQSGGGLGFGVVIGIVAALWTAGGGVGALIRGLNIVHGEGEMRTAVRRRGLALVLTIAGVVGTVAVLGLIVALPPIVRRLTDSGLAASIVVTLRWPVLGLLLLVALAVLYRVAPTRPRPRRHWTSWGAVVAMLVWLAASAGFSLYIDRMGSYNETYGSLGAVIILMLWLYISAFVVLLGGEIDAVMEDGTARS